jgi:hypothetical protein
MRRRGLRGDRDSLRENLVRPGESTTRSWRTLRMGTAEGDEA